MRAAGVRGGGTASVSAPTVTSADSAGGGGALAAASSSAAGASTGAVAADVISSAATLAGVRAHHRSTHLHYGGCASLAGELLRQSLSEYLRAQVAHVTQIIVLFGFNEHSYDEDDDIPIKEGRLVYAAITQSELVLIDRRAIAGLSLAAVAPSYEEITRASHASGGRTQRMVKTVPFRALGKVSVDPDCEDRFELLLRSDRGSSLPACFLLSSVHRKAFCEQLTVLYNAHFALGSIASEVAAVPVANSKPKVRDPEDPRFSVITTGSQHSISHMRTLEISFSDDGSDEDDDEPSPWQHPAEQFYSALPSKYRGKIFHTCGYMFSTPPYVATGAEDDEEGAWVDPANGAFGNRQTSTFRYERPSDTAMGRPLHMRKYLQVIVCPEQSLTPCSNIVRGRDLRGELRGRAVGKCTLHDPIGDRDDCEDADFHQWSEALGRSIAMNECRVSDTSDYYERQRIVHIKKINVAGDKASWVCFKMHIATHTREIALITCRRKCIPPYCDTRQDLAFILYGACVDPPPAAAGAAASPLDPAIAPPPIPAADPALPLVDTLVLSAKSLLLLSELELVVDTLSPTVVPLPYHYAHAVSPTLIHPTYADVPVLQARLNALMFNSISYHWLSTRAWLSSVAGTPGLVPTTEFLGAPCFKLARSFANAILVRVSSRDERVVWSERMPVVVEGIGFDAAFHGGRSSHGGGVSEESKMDSEIQASGAAPGSATSKYAAANESAVDDPMDIVERMCTEFVVHEQTKRRVASEHSSSGTYSGEEEWRCRVSQFLLYCVDDGIFPGALNVKRLLNVIIGNLPDAPLITFETANKLERVVDFLLYLKRRCGRPLDLPSLWSASKQSSAATGASFSAQLRPSTQQHAEITATFASLAHTSPYALATDGHAHLNYDYDPHTSLLHKLRDVSLMSNFTCNEHMMVLLLDANYVEYLESSALNTNDHSDASVLPQLLTSLLVKDYNIALVRAVCDKIILNQIQYDGFIPALIALAKDGSVHAAIYSLRALTFLARQFPFVIYEYGGVTVGMWHICMSKNEDLIDAAIDMTLELVTNQTIHIFGQAGFVRKLVDILRPRVGQQQLRYRSSLLQKACSLVLKFSQVPSLLSLCLSNYCHKELIDILSRGVAYEPILLHVSACMGQLYVNAGSQIMGLPSETAQHDATVLVRTLSNYTSREHLRLCLNLLIILQYLLRLPKGYYSRLTNTRHSKITGAIQFTLPDPAFEQRTHVLQHMCEEENLEGVLDELLRTAVDEEERTETALQLTGALIVIEGRKVVTMGADTAGNRDDWLLGRRTVAKNCKEKARWFRTRINFAKVAEWNIRALWQKDNNKQFLAIPKA